MELTHLLACERLLTLPTCNKSLRKPDNMTWTGILGEVYHYLPS